MWTWKRTLVGVHPSITILFLLSWTQSGQRTAHLDHVQQPHNVLMPGLPEHRYFACQGLLQLLVQFLCIYFLYRSRGTRDDVMSLPYNSEGAYGLTAMWVGDVQFSLMLHNHVRWILFNKHRKRKNCVEIIQ